MDGLSFSIKTSVQDVLYQIVYFFVFLYSCEIYDFGAQNYGKIKTVP